MSLLQILSFNDWVKVLAAIDKDKGEGLNFVREMTAQIPVMAKNLQTELTRFAAKGSMYSNFLRKLCKLEPMFVSTPATPVIPVGGWQHLQQGSGGHGSYTQLPK